MQYYFLVNMKLSRPPIISETNHSDKIGCDLFCRSQSRQVKAKNELMQVLE